MAVKDTGITPLEDGRYHVDIRPWGRDGPRRRKKCKTLADARRWKNKQIAEAQNQGANYGVIELDKRRLSDLVEPWWDCAGYELKDGKKRKQKLEATIRGVGDSIASKFQPAQFLQYRKKRLEDGISANTVNKEKVYLSSMFNVLIKAKLYKGFNPLSEIKPLKVVDPELTFLSIPQVGALLAECGKLEQLDLLKICKICLATGGRFGEGQGLARHRLVNSKVSYIDTKNGTNRTIPIAKELQAEILEGAPRSGLLFTQEDLSGDFKACVKAAGIVLPKGQLTHVLRHTFASHFIMKGGNILVLNKILGHKTLQQTMIYAHLAPEHFIDAVKFNVVCNLKGESDLKVSTPQTINHQ